MGEVIGGILGGVGSIAGAMIQADAAEKARKQALTGYNYLTEGAGKTTSNAFVDYGRRGVQDADIARNAQMQLLGLAPIPGEDGSQIYPPGTASPGDALRAPDNPGMAPTGTNGFSPRGPGMRQPAITGGTAPVMFGDPHNRVVSNDVPTTAGPMAPGPGGVPTTGGPMAPGPGGVPAVAGGVPNAGNAFNNYKNSTGYNFQLDEGTNAIASNAAARGLLNSSATAKAMTKYGQNLASTTFNNYLAQLGGIGTAGQNAGTLGQNQLGMVTNAGTGAGSVAAGFIQDGGNAWSNGINGALGSASQIFSNLPPRSTGIPQRVAGAVT